MIFFSQCGIYVGNGYPIKYQYHPLYESGDTRVTVYQFDQCVNLIYVEVV